ncbi:MAG: DNA alkylation repair protein, partial [Acholeplasmataceae bacterium]|nr:DNA alkylation repair protein [Acholeplasmataceae bacterium]
KEVYNRNKQLTKKEIFALCEELWKSGVFEESIIACEWSYYLHKEYLEEDFSVFVHWLENYVHNWASCDTLCNHTIGTFLEMYPQYIKELKVWTQSPNRWLRRAAAVSLIIPAREGLFREDIFEIVDKLLLDTDDMVQKGYGWLLKSLATKYEEEVFKYVLSKKAIMPRTSLRYAIEKMPKEKKEEAMKR